MHDFVCLNELFPLSGFRHRAIRTATVALVAFLGASCGSGGSVASVATTMQTTTTPAPTEAVVSTTDPGTSTTSAPPSIDSAGALRIHISPGADWLAIADGSVWTSAGRGIVPLDPITGAPGPTTEILGICLAFDVGYDSLWVGACEDPAIWRIDPSDGAVLATIPLSVDGIEEEGSVAAGEGGVWVVSTANELIKVDPVTNQVAGSWPLPSGAAAVRAGLGSLWVTISTADQVLRIDPADPTSQTPIDVGGYPRFLAVGEDAVWIMNQRDGSVTRVAADGSVVTTIKVATRIQGGDIAVGGGSVWVQPGGELLIRIDPATNEVIATYGPRSGSGSVAADDSAVWVSAHDVEAIWRLPFP